MAQMIFWPTFLLFDAAALELNMLPFGDGH